MCKIENGGNPHGRRPTIERQARRALGVGLPQRPHSTNMSALGEAGPSTSRQTAGTAKSQTRRTLICISVRWADSSINRPLLITSRCHLSGPRGDQRADRQYRHLGTLVCVTLLSIYAVYGLCQVITGI